MLIKKSRRPEHLKLKFMDAKKEFSIKHPSLASPFMAGEFSD